MFQSAPPDEPGGNLLMHQIKTDDNKVNTGSPPPNTELNVAKHRHGPTGSIQLRFRREFTRFECV